MGLSLCVYQFLQELRRDLSLKGFPRPLVEGHRNRIGLTSGIAAEICALREVWTKQAVGVGICPPSARISPINSITRFDVRNGLGCVAVFLPIASQTAAAHNRQAATDLLRAPMSPGIGRPWAPSTTPPRRF